MGVAPVWHPLLLSHWAISLTLAQRPSGPRALFAISSLTFTLAKYAGALYLIFLAVRAVRTTVAAQATCERAAPTRIFRDGFIVAALNPETTNFFAAFLPHFLATKTPIIGATSTLRALFALIAASTDSAYALTAGMLSPAFARVDRMLTLGRYASASALIGLGLFTAFAGSREAK